MNYMRVAVLILMPIVGFTSCEGESRPEEVSVYEHSHSESITLNDGVKWKVVPDMMQHIKSMNDSVLGFDSENYDALGLSLKEDLDLLTSNCTMTGAAHDELHKWLLPYIELVDELNEAEADKLKKESFNKIEASFKTFNTFFE